MKMNLKGKMKIGNAVPTAGLGESKRSTLIFMVGTRVRGRIWLGCGFIGCDLKNNGDVRRRTVRGKRLGQQGNECVEVYFSYCLKMMRRFSSYFLSWMFSIQ
jgi:hypothetical protein